jgi:hypothetical protein
VSEAHQFARDFGVLGIAVITFLLFWRGSEKLGIVGFGKEYQLRRIAEERIANASERTEKAQGEIKDLIGALPGAVAKAVHEVVQGILLELRPPLRASQPPSPSPPPSHAPSSHAGAQQTTPHVVRQ